MKRVTGIGGIFFKAKDPKALQAWYKQHLGIDVQVWGGASFDWTDADGKPVGGTTAWSISSIDDNSYNAPFMVNYRVADLQALLAALREEAATFLIRLMNQNTASLAGSSTPKATKSSSGNHPPASKTFGLV
jgi:hypothetical protein